MMRKDVQALLNKRRRSRMVIPYIFLSIMVVILLGIVGLIINFFINGPGQTLFYTATPTPTITPTVTPTVPTPTPTPTVPTPTPSATFGPSPTPTPVVHQVREGDTLFGLAVQYQVSVEAIRIYNNLTRDSLSVGQVLTIPVGLVIPTITPTPLPPNLRRGQEIRYVVQLGDTLEAIAQRFSTLATEISKRNNNITNTTLQAGQVLTVPVNLVTATRTPIPTFTPFIPPTATP